MIDDWRFDANRKPVQAGTAPDRQQLPILAIAAAEAGVGITRPLSYQVEASVRAGRLTPILQQFAPPPSPVNAIYPSRRIPSANVTVFIKTARDYFKTEPLSPVSAWKKK